MKSAASPTALKTSVALLNLAAAAALTLVLLDYHALAPGIVSSLSGHILAAGALCGLVGLLVCGKVGRTGRTGAGSMAVAMVNLALSASLAAPVLIRSQAQAVQVGAEWPEIRVLTANLWTDYTSFSRFAALVEREQPDILFLQEAYEPWQTLLQRGLPDYTLAAGCEHPHLCGSVILTRLPVAALRSVDQGGVVAAILQIGGAGGAAHDVLVVGVHIYRTDEITAPEQMQAVRSLADEAGLPVIVAGDFNMTPWHPRLRELEAGAALRRVTGLAPSWPTRSRMRHGAGIGLAVPGVSIDHIYAGRSWTRAGPVNRTDFGSDHYAVATRLVLAP